jgi:hypothetical protein
MPSDLLNNRCEGRLIANREVSKHLPVETDVCVIQTGDKAAVGHSMFTHGRVDPRNPEAAEHALAITTVAVGVLTSTHDRLFGDPEDVLATTTITFGQRDDFFVAGTGGYATFNSGHYDLLRIE